MQVPEKLSLIGGSILLASTLVFTLKSQASSIIPHVGHSISHVFDHVGDAQDNSEFGNGYQDAQQKHWKTGTWGTSKYYIDDQNNIYISKGSLPHNDLANVIGKQQASNLRSVNFTQAIHVPDNTSSLLSSLPQVTHINGLNNWDISNSKDLTWVFAGDSSLRTLDLSHWDMSMNTYLGEMFNGDQNLHSLDITSFHDAWIMGDMFDNTGLSQVTVGKDTNLWGGQDLQRRGKWKAPDGFIGDFPGGDHPGTWTLQ